MAVEPRPAATVILMRETDGNSVQVFLLKRHEASAFMGGNFVYPGGRMDDRDTDRGIEPYCRGLEANPLKVGETGDADERELLGYPICAIRELFEEAGILLAYDLSGKFLETDALPDRDRYTTHRRLVDTKKMSMTELAHRESLIYALDQLYYLDRWITPVARNIRFDTRFYVAFCPPGQEASSDQTETVQGLWMSPHEALEANLKGSIALSPPTLETLEVLSPFETREAVLRFVQNRESRTVLPILTKTVDGPVILFPWDEEYSLLNRDKAAEPRTSRLRNYHEKTTRVLMKDGRWLPCRPEETSP